ncbi:MAG: ligase [Burkholderiales bacterium]|nr:ligase [Burkholderiales bacterium]OJX05947.1 MAG: hypothetical protein BGO72_04620 [Burkholderiales bacterium 70-64]
MPVAEASIAEEHAWCAGVLAAPLAAPRWRVWRYRAPEIVLGCAQRALHEAAMRRAPRGVAVTVRPSGGGAVLAGPWMVGVTVVLPPGHALLGEGLVDSYRWLGELHAGVLAQAGIAARALDPRVQRPAPDAAGATGAAHAATAAGVRWACFGALSPWEVVAADGRKLTGLSQQRKRAGVAYSAGTLVARPDWRLLCEALGEPADAARLHALTAACEETPAAAGLDAAAWAERLDTALAARLDDGGPET